MSGVDNLIAYIDNGGTRSGRNGGAPTEWRISPTEELGTNAEAALIVEGFSTKKGRLEKSAGRHFTTEDLTGKQAASQLP